MLNLSTNSVTAKTCAVLSKVIAADHVFVEYKFADCMLSEDGKSMVYKSCHEKNCFLHSLYAINKDTDQLTTHVLPDQCICCCLPR